MKNGKFLENLKFCKIENKNLNLENFLKISKIENKNGKFENFLKMLNYEKLIIKI